MFLPHPLSCPCSRRWVCFARPRTPRRRVFRSNTGGGRRRRRTCEKTERPHASTDWHRSAFAVPAASPCAAVVLVGSTVPQTRGDPVQKVGAKSRDHRPRIESAGSTRTTLPMASFFCCAWGQPVVDVTMGCAILQRDISQALHGSEGPAASPASLPPSSTELAPPPPPLPPSDVPADPAASEPALPELPWLLLPPAKPEPPALGDASVPGFSTLPRAPVLLSRTSCPCRRRSWRRRRTK